MQEVLTAFERHAANGGGFVFATTTVQHEVGEGLAFLLDLLGGAWQWVTRHREYKGWRERIGLVGYIAALEVTDGGHGWHPHRHLMLLTERPLSRDEVQAFEAVLDGLYGLWIARQGRKRGGIDLVSGRPVGVRLDYVPADDQAARRQLGRYLTKLQAGFELTRGDLKASRSAKGRLPFDLIDDVQSGGPDTARAVARWREYEAAMTGKSAVRFSRGLRAHLGMEPAKSDEELAEEEVGGEPEVFLTAPVYRRVFRDGHAPAVLVAQTVAGTAGVLRFLNERYPGELEATDEEFRGLALLIGFHRCE